MEKQIECEICGKYFITKRGNAKYCSDKCRDKAKEKRESHCGAATPQ